MRKQNILSLLCVALLSSCFQDDTTNGDGVISVISIDQTSMQPVYNINKNETLKISPKVTQEGVEHELTYTWEVEQKTYSTAPELEYIGTRLGRYRCRLVVENIDGKEFYPFTINVNSPYEQGYTMLSVDEQGKSMVSFMMTNRTDGAEEHFDVGDCFTVNNPDERFASNAADIVHCDRSLIIACRGSGTTSDPGTLYYLNDKTMVMENKLSTAEYPDFKPTRMAIPASGAIGVSYPILSEDGHVYEFSTSEGALTRAVKLQYTYAQQYAVHSGASAGYYGLYFWDKEVGDMCMLLNGYGPYYCSSTYLLERKDVTATNNYFNGLEFITMCIVPQLASSTSPSELLVITRNGMLYQKTRFPSAGFWGWNPDTGVSELVEIGSKTVAGLGAVKLTEQSPIAASGKYLAVFYADGNTVYRWNYTTKQRIDQAKAHVQVGSADAVVTCMQVSNDQNETLVAFYEPKESGLNGHVWVVNTDTGEVLRKYDNVGYRPVKLIYKKK